MRKWQLFVAEFRPNPTTTVLDVGFQDAQHQAADNFIESHYQWPAQITALGIEEPTHFSERYPDVNTVVYDGRDFPFADQSFDIVWSNAVLEHVGDQYAQILFLREARRVGRSVFLTTPNRGFPIEVHSRLPLLHWLPKETFDSILCRIGMPQFAGDYMRLLRLGELRRLLAAAGFDPARTRIVRNRLAGPTLDFVVIAR